MNTNYNSTNIREAKGIQKYIGIMFQKKPKPLMFKWDHPVNLAIHSHFCVPFLAKWFDESDEVIHEKVVVPFLNEVRCPKPFVKLIEYPVWWLEKNPFVSLG